jgi:hypothetical protein
MTIPVAAELPRSDTQYSPRQNGRGSSQNLDETSDSGSLVAVDLPRTVARVADARFAPLTPLVECVSTPSDVLSSNERSLRAGFTSTPRRAARHEQRAPAPSGLALIFTIGGSILAVFAGSPPPTSSAWLVSWLRVWWRPSEVPQSLPQRCGSSTMGGEEQ